MRRSNHGSRIQTSKIMLRYLRIISEINCDLDGVSLNQFVNNRIIHRATIMSVNLISEATNTLGDSFKRNNPQVNWYMIRLLRNELIHNYYATSKYFLWTFVKDTLPMIEKLLLII